jgi:hypothetical protein
MSSMFSAPLPSPVTNFFAASSICYLHCLVAFATIFTWTQTTRSIE